VSPDEWLQVPSTMPSRPSSGVQPIQCHVSLSSVQYNWVSESDCEPAIRSLSPNLCPLRRHSFPSATFCALTFSTSFSSLHIPTANCSRLPLKTDINRSSRPEGMAQLYLGRGHVATPSTDLGFPCAFRTVFRGWYGDDIRLGG
jgi:hypothetical protein